MGISNSKYSQIFYINIININIVKIYAVEEYYSLNNFLNNLLHLAALLHEDEKNRMVYKKVFKITFHEKPLNFSD